jgi:hypothetical protein
VALIATVALVVNAGLSTENGTDTGGWFLVVANLVGQIRSGSRLCGLAKRAEPKLDARQHANRSLQTVHVPGGRECLCASGTIASRIEPLGARQGR